MINTGNFTKKIEEQREAKKLLVLKGSSNLSINFSKIVDNKLKYFTDFVQSGREYMYYSEYVMLYNFVIDQYEKITVIENNLYNKYYPLDVQIDSELLELAYKRFQEEEGNGLNRIDELINVYGNLMVIKGNCYVVYNEPMDNEKVNSVHLWDLVVKEEEILRARINNNEDAVEIIDEEDYLALVERILNEANQEVHVTLNSPLFNKSTLLSKVGLLNAASTRNSKAYIVYLQSQPAQSKSIDHFKQILKKYWGYEEFLQLEVYDNSLLEENKKELQRISQGQIIHTLVEEAVKASKNNKFRDVFITAPTGAGKSAIFQIPSVYLAEEFNLVTIIISPLIALMNDQVRSLEKKGVHYAKTINSNVSPIQKQEIIAKLHSGECHILYISPETLLSYSSLEQFIGQRSLGLLVIDEAHIVTTWGKQFRPDYWFLGDHIRKIRKKQVEEKNSSFPIATFTATAIFGGFEDMYNETRESLHMIQPITYLGKVRRNDIVFDIKQSMKKREYELEKFEQLIDLVKRALVTQKKTLIYFPTVALIKRFYDFCVLQNLNQQVSIYHGQLDSFEKQESYEKFLGKENLVMLATKAFGMGVDIDDIEIVAHFAPTGNVCDYVQEIGRVARNKNLSGEAYYRFMSNDFKHINRLHGLSTIQEYQLVGVIQKIHDLYITNLKKKAKGKGRNQMLIDAASFSHIFETPFYDTEDAISKVKTAMLMIQKDYERRFGYSPFYVRPIPLFSFGFFQINDEIAKELIKQFGANVAQLVDIDNRIYKLNLQVIWENTYSVKFSFPQFKFLLYTQNEEIKFSVNNAMIPAFMVELTYESDFYQKCTERIGLVQNIFETFAIGGRFLSISEISAEIKDALKVNIYKARYLTEVLISAILTYQKNHNKSMTGTLLSLKMQNDGTSTYRVNSAVFSFFQRIYKCSKDIIARTRDNILYLANSSDISLKEYMLHLGVLETCELLNFDLNGGRDSQMYIYINSLKVMRGVLAKPSFYRNNLLELVKNRHIMSVAMLTHLYSNDFSNEERWDLIENYFLGTIPEEVIKNYEQRIEKAAI